LYGRDGTLVFYLYRNRSSLEENRYYTIILITFIRLQIDAD